MLLTITSCILVCSSITACAAEPPFNPDNLGPDQFARVSDVCQTVIGLKPTEPLVGGDRTGNDRLDYWTSHYRGCITSLSDSMQKAADVQVAKQADEDCRAKGLKSDSPDLALCVLHSVSVPNPGAAPPSTASLTPISEKLTPPTRSFFFASPHETRHREELACAVLGFEPPHGAFSSCVKDLNDTFYAIDNPIN